MSEKYRNGRPVRNEDNENTRTTVIPPEARQQYREQYQQPYQQPQPQPQPQPQYYQQPYQPQQQQYQQPQQQYYQGQPQQPQYQQYQGQPYQGQPQPQYYQQPQQGQYYQGQTQQQQYYQQPQQQYYQQPQQPRQPLHRGEAPAPQMRRPVPQPSRPAPAPTKQKKKKKRKSSGVWRFFKRLFYVLLILFILIFGIYSCTAISLIRKLDYVPTGDREHTSGAISRSYVTSILLIGTDGRSLDERGRSDTMMLVSVNSATNKVNTTSFMRDCYVEIPNYGWDKLNAAYSYGGPELLMDTIEHNFGVRIDDYVCINFLSFASIVDSVGGIDVDLSDAEAEEINVILQAEVNEIMGDDRYADLLSGGGKSVHLVGKQALAYARIRHIGNADFERTERQRRVVDLVMDKLKKFSPITLKNLSTKVLPDVTTNMTTGELYLLSLRGPMILGYDRVPLQVPVEGTYQEGYYDYCGSVLEVDFDSNYETLKDTVYSKD